MAALVFIERDLVRERRLFVQSLSQVDGAAHHLRGELVAAQPRAVLEDLRGDD
jgi:hypothetical protein